MKICLRCDQLYASHDWKCPSCGAAPEVIDGFLALAPEKARKNKGFNPDSFKDLVRLEAQNFWFKSRNELIIWALNTYFPQAGSFLEIGCGTGFVLSGVRRKRSDLRLYGSDIYSAGLAFASARVSDAEFFQMDAKEIPFYEEFDVIGAFDVLEHVENDELALHEIHQGVTKGGGIIVTVPQHEFLWSCLDEHAHHVRRYCARGLTKKLERTGFALLKVTSFVSVLLPFMLLSRIVKRRSEKVDVLAELMLPRYLNYLFERSLDAERAFLKRGLSLPVGGSLLAIAKKR